MWSDISKSWILFLEHYRYDEKTAVKCDLNITMEFYIIALKN